MSHWTRFHSTRDGSDMFSLSEYISNPKLWKSSRKCSLLALLLFEAAPKKDSSEDTKAMLVKEQAQINGLFGKCPLLGLNGDDVERLRRKEEGGELNKSADIYVFHGELSDPLHMVECKYRYALAEDEVYGCRVRSIFEELQGKFTASRSFLVRQGRDVDDMVWVVSNSKVASILKSEIVDLCVEAGFEPFNVVDNDGLHEDLSKIGLPMEENGG